MVAEMNICFLFDFRAPVQWSLRYYLCINLGHFLSEFRQTDRNIQ